MWLTIPRNRRRRLALTGLGIVTVLALVAVLAWPVPLDERVRRIRPGMTRDEVEAVLGSPPGHYRTDGGVTSLKQPVERSLVWDRDDGFVVVQFDPTGAVQQATHYPGPRPPSLIGQWLQRLPW